jgi:hypothetical protein
MPRLFLILLLGLGLAAAAGAQEVEVTAVRFSNVRASNGGSGNWLEADVALNVRPPTGLPGQMVGRVRVTLLIGFELPGGAGGQPAPGGERVEGRRLEHYRAEAECVALEAGRSDVRFYLPPEIVKRDQLHGDPRFWGVELSAGGRPIPAGKAAYSATLGSVEQRRNFQGRAAAAAAPNDGVLLPQYLTPFAHDYPRATPSFVRREAK